MNNCHWLKAGVNLICQQNSPRCFIADVGTYSGYKSQCRKCNNFNGISSRGTKCVAKCYMSKESKNEVGQKSDNKLSQKRLLLDI
ncbi:hypothetical protein CEXT_190611 [Caerostris extrusa]|uniref:Uncharacterized protein n=1 Tax=Caerostris extrusa TaxID=172846 RepID=A0AAV4MIZ1_CAEEX|nr:hypothetical protein CEXT_190611 [Caerostris extrusa]